MQYIYKCSSSTLSTCCKKPIHVAYERAYNVMSYQHVVNEVIHVAYGWVYKVTTRTCRIWMCL